MLACDFFVTITARVRTLYVFVGGVTEKRVRAPYTIIAEHRYGNGRA
jgi:hypothetical protein